MIQTTSQAVFKVSTHSRLKAAGLVKLDGEMFPDVSTHSRLKAAGTFKVEHYRELSVSTHSRLKAAGRLKTNDLIYCALSQGHF